MKRSLLRIATIVLAQIFFVGCNQTSPPTTPVKSNLLTRLQIVEWDLSSQIGDTMVIEGVNGADGKCEFPVTADTTLVTQRSEVHDSVIVYILDAKGTATTVIQTGAMTGELTLGDQSEGVLYHHNDTPVVTATKKGT